MPATPVVWGTQAQWHGLRSTWRARHLGPRREIRTLDSGGIDAGFESRADVRAGKERSTTSSSLLSVQPLRRMDRGRGKTQELRSHRP
jgi:hypothetical protein